MASVRDTIYRSLWNYPWVDKTRTSVLEHLFYVYGNGYVWRDGELIETSLPPWHDGPLYPREHDQFTLDPDGPYTPPGSKFLEEMEARRKHERDFVRDNIDAITDTVAEATFLARMKEQRKLIGRKYLYPAGSKICSLPDNIKPDWWHAAEEILNLTLETDILDMDRRILRQANTRLQQIARTQQRQAPLPDA